MKQPSGIQSAATFTVIILTGGLLAWAGSQGGKEVTGTPALFYLAALSFIIQWTAFIPAYMMQSEKFFDLTGSLTFVTLITLALIMAPALDARAFLIWTLVVVWAVRLGSHLVRRIRKAGRDDRFDALKPSFIQFLNVWTVQALWVICTLMAALVAMLNATRRPLGGMALAGALLWLLGFTVEALADLQKSRFASDAANRGRFIQTGLWARSRHPNYFGEIMLWTGVALIAMPVFSGWQWIALISPLFVILLLTRVSGIPLLEKKADLKWGGQPDYEAYKKQTPVLIPKIR